MRAANESYALKMNIIVILKAGRYGTQRRRPILSEVMEGRYLLKIDLNQVPSIYTGIGSARRHENRRFMLDALPWIINLN